MARQPATHRAETEYGQECCPAVGRQPNVTISSTDRAHVVDAVWSYPTRGHCGPGSAACKRRAHPSRSYLEGNARGCARLVYRRPCRSDCACGSATAVPTACNVHTHRC